NPERAAFTGSTMNLDDSLMPLHNPERGRQSQAAPRELGGEERIENLRDRRVIHSGAIVLHFEHDVFSRLDFTGRREAGEERFIETLDGCSYRHSAWSIADRLGGINYQVHRELLHLRHVRYDRWQAGRQLELQQDCLGNRGPDQAAHSTREVPYIHRLDSEL